MGFVCKDDLNWESVGAPFAEPTSDDEEFAATGDDDEATMAGLPWSGADDVYCPEPDKDPYVYESQDCET
jgi:hypothetical protein